MEVVEEVCVEPPCDFPLPISRHAITEGALTLSIDATKEAICTISHQLFMPFQCPWVRVQVNIIGPHSGVSVLGALGLGLGLGLG